MDEELNRSHHCDRYDVLKKMCRQQLMLNESLKLELSKLGQLLQKVSHERDILLSELLENHSSCSPQSTEDKEFRGEENKRHLYHFGSHKRPQSSVDSNHGPVKFMKDSITGNLSTGAGHSQDLTDTEVCQTVDADFDDLELPVTSRLKSPLLSPTPSTSEGSHTQVPTRFSDRMHQPSISSSSCTNNTTVSDSPWTPNLTGSDSPPTVTTITRATKPSTLLSNSLVSTSATVLSQRPTLITNQIPGAAKHQSTSILSSPKLAFSGPPRPRLVTNVSVIGKPMQHTNVITGQQQRIVIQTSLNAASTARRFPRPPVSVQNTISNSQGEYF